MTRCQEPGTRYWIRAVQRVLELLEVFWIMEPELSLIERARGLVAVVRQARGQ